MSDVETISGQQFALRAGHYRADITSVGASLRTLTYDGRDLVLPYRADELRPLFRGAVLAPWPNRVVDGRWTWRGEELQLPLTEPDRGHALHGLVAWQDWRPRRITESSVVLETAVVAQVGYPFPLALSVEWSLESGGLTCRLYARNTGTTDAPYGATIHPYLVAPDGPLDEWTLELPAQMEMLTDARLAPSALVPITAAHDFRRPRHLGDTVIDHAFTDITFGPEGRAAVTLSGASGRGVRMEFDETAPWVQICTSDWPGRPGHRAGVAVEPMTCPPDAFTSGTDLVVLPPGAGHELVLRIAAVPNL